MLDVTMLYGQTHSTSFLFVLRRSGASCQGFRLCMRDRVSSQGSSWICKPSAFRPKRTSPKKKHAIGHEVSAIITFHHVTPNACRSVPAQNLIEVLLFFTQFSQVEYFILHYFIFYFLIRVRYVRHVTMINKKIKINKINKQRVCLIHIGLVLPNNN